MRTASDHRARATAAVSFLIFVGTAAAQYGGGTGTSDDPYQICTAEQMNAIGGRPDDWDKHFRLMADIDLGGYTGQQFRIIGRDLPGSVPFSGSFDGNGHRIHHFTYRSPGGNSVGLFGFIRTGFGSPPAVRNLGLVDPNVDGGRGEGVAALVGQLFNGTIRDCYIEGGRIAGFASVGGLVGFTAPTSMGGLERDVVSCCSSCEVSGDSMVGGVAGAVSSQTRVLDCRSFGTVSGRTHVGGLVGASAGARIAACSTRAHVIGKSWTGGLLGSCTGGYEAVTACTARGDVAGEEDTGGLVGWNIYGVITDSYATAPVSGVARVGGLVGANQGTVNACYAAGLVQGESQAGGLVGSASADSFYPDGTVTGSFWDVDASGRTTSAGGTGKTTAGMQTAATFAAAGWDFVGETTNGTADTWWILEGQDYPRLSWEPMGKYGGGTGRADDPYLIFTAEQMRAIGMEPCAWDKRFKLMADIDMSAYPDTVCRPIGFVTYYSPHPAASCVSKEGRAFTGVFDGNGKKISHFSCRSEPYAGLFGVVDYPAVIMNLTLVDPNVSSDSAAAGALVGSALCWEATVKGCHVQNGTVSAPKGTAGGLISANAGYLLDCSFTGRVLGGSSVGGLVGDCDGTISRCCSNAEVSGDSRVGGLAGRFRSTVDGRDYLRDCYSRGRVTGVNQVGGLVGVHEGWPAVVAVAPSVFRCYSAAVVTGADKVGGLIGAQSDDAVSDDVSLFWDVQVSTQAASAGGIGKTTAEMQTASTFRAGGWDLAGETADDALHMWWTLEGQDYPRLWWEAPTE